MPGFHTVNPASGETLETYSFHDDAAIAAALDKAETAYRRWRTESLSSRAALLGALAARLRAEKGALAHMAALEMGKVLREGEAEVEKCAVACEYFASHAEEFLSDYTIATEWKKSYVAFRPLGVVLAIMPWNFPFWQVLRAAIPALLAGNTMLLKHASNVPAAALKLEQLLREAGFPAGVFTTLLIPGSRASVLIADPRIRAVTLTGSTPAGRAVASAAGAGLKKCVLELGGSDAYVILADADIELAAKMLSSGRLMNAGQSCISPKRMVVEKSVRADFEEALLAHFRAAVAGDPLDAASTLGPMARADLRDDLHEQVARSVASGARCLLGGKVPSGPGAFYPPTVLSGVAAGMAAYSEELFGPVAAIIEARDETDALRIANDTPFGLGGGIYTRDLEKGERLAREHMESGSAFVNGFVRSDPRLPFGGVGDSGYGRELSIFGIREFVNIKSVAVA